MFDGLIRTCVRFRTASNGAYRYAEYKPAAEVGIHPSVCPPGMQSRSPGLIRLKQCSPKAQPKSKLHRPGPRAALAPALAPARKRKRGKAHGKARRRG